MRTKKRSPGRSRAHSAPPTGHVAEAVLEAGHHAARVDAWLEQSAKNLAPEALLELFEAALNALWARTETTLGEVTLTAIAGRVLYNAAEQFPFLSTLALQSTGGIQCAELQERIGSVHGLELKRGMRFVLVELLTVLGNLTAEILTPELHSELSNVALPKSVRAGRGARRPPTRPTGAGEDKGS